MEQKISIKETLRNLKTIDFTKERNFICSFAMSEDDFFNQLMMKKCKNYLGTISEGPFFLPKDFLNPKYQNKSGYEESKEFFEQFLNKNVFSIQYHQNPKTLGPFLEVFNDKNIIVIPIGFELIQLKNLPFLKDYSSVQSNELNELSQKAALIDLQTLSKDYFPQISQNQEGIELHELISKIQSLVINLEVRHIIFCHLSKKDIKTPGFRMSPEEETTKINLEFLLTKIQEVYTLCQ